MYLKYLNSLGPHVFCKVLQGMGPWTFAFWLQFVPVPFYPTPHLHMDPPKGFGVWCAGGSMCRLVLLWPLTLLPPLPIILVLKRLPSYVQEEVWTNLQKCIFIILIHLQFQWKSSKRSISLKSMSVSHIDYRQAVKGWADSVISKKRMFVDALDSRIEEGRSVLG